MVLNNKMGLLVLFLLGGLDSVGQYVGNQIFDTLNFNKIISVRIYNHITHHDFLEASDTILFQLEHDTIPTREIKPLLLDIIATGSKTALWSGRLLGLFIFEDKIRKVRISETGFKNETDNQYYLLLDEDKEKWGSLFKKQFSAVKPVLR